MLVRPRKTKYNNIFKRRRLHKRFASIKLRFGQYGICILQPLRLTIKHFLRVKLFLKRSSRKVDKTSRYVWFNLFPHLPFSRKIKGSRMGKGSGKLVNWVADLSPMVILAEFKNLRMGRYYYYLNQLRYQLPVALRAVVLNPSSRKIELNLRPSLKITYASFW